MICIASDHGEMLFDRSVTAKSKPWSSASSVPLICSGSVCLLCALLHLRRSMLADVRLARLIRSMPPVVFLVCVLCEVSLSARGGAPYSLCYVPGSSRPRPGITRNTVSPPPPLC